MTEILKCYDCKRDFKHVKLRSRSRCNYCIIENTRKKARDKARAIAKEKTKPKLNESIDRKCLNCGRKLQAENRFIRLCNPCKH